MQSGRYAAEDGTESLEGRFLMLENLVTDDDGLYLEGDRDIFNFYNMGIRLRVRF